MRHKNSERTNISTSWFPHFHRPNQLFHVPSGWQEWTATFVGRGWRMGTLWVRVILFIHDRASTKIGENLSTTEEHVWIRTTNMHGSIWALELPPDAVPSTHHATGSRSAALEIAPCLLSLAVLGSGDQLAKAGRRILATYPQFAHESKSTSSFLPLLSFFSNLPPLNQTKSLLIRSVRANLSRGTERRREISERRMGFGWTRSTCLQIKLERDSVERQREYSATTIESNRR